MKIRPTADQLRRHFHYEAETGKLYFKDRPDSDFRDGKYSASRVAAMWRSKFLGKEFGSWDDKGYRRGWYYGRFYRAHQIIWCMRFGRWPNQIDHDDGNRGNNRIANLKEATTRQNCRNRKISTSNVSGTVGVRQHGNKWIAAIGNSRDSKGHLGTFGTFEQAVAARQAAERRLGYHPNHGRKS
jgi:hypothetical protein